MITKKQIVAACDNDVSSLQHIAQSLHTYQANARLEVPKDATDHMLAMTAVAKCDQQVDFLELLEAHVDKRRYPKQATARYRFSAALEARAAHVKEATKKIADPEMEKQRQAFIQTCMLRAERNLLQGYAYDRGHYHAFAYFSVNPNAAPCTRANVASRTTQASLGQMRSAPALYPPLINASIPLKAGVAYNPASFATTTNGVISPAQTTPFTIMQVSQAPSHVRFVAPDASCATMSDARHATWTVHSMAPVVHQPVVRDLRVRAAIERNMAAVSPPTEPLVPYSVQLSSCLSAKPTPVPVSNNYVPTMAHNSHHQAEQKNAFVAPQSVLNAFTPAPAGGTVGHVFAGSRHARLRLGHDRTFACRRPSHDGLFGRTFRTNFGFCRP